MMVGERLRYLMARRGLTPRWLSERLGIEEGELDEWFDGMTVPPPAMEELLERMLGSSVESTGLPVDEPEHHLRGLRKVLRRRRRGSRSHSRL